MLVEDNRKESILRYMPLVRGDIKINIHGFVSAFPSHSDVNSCTGNETTRKE
jgi:hypothetical protein